jgi:hypothetical protein
MNQLPAREFQAGLKISRIAYILCLPIVLNTPTSHFFDNRRKILLSVVIVNNRDLHDIRPWILC